MKKIYAFSFVFVLSFILLGFNANSARAVNCAPGDLFNTTTGQPCGATATVVACAPGHLFNAVTGRSCNATTPPPQDNVSRFNSLFIGPFDIGGRGSAVLALQQFLKDEGYYFGKIDGKYGRITDRAVKDFREDNDITNPPIINSCVQFPPLRPDWCTGGTIIPQGLDANGCQLLPRCSLSTNPPTQTCTDVTGTTCPYMEGLCWYPQNWNLPACNKNLTNPVISEVNGPQSLNVNQQGTWTVKAHDPAGGTLSYSVIWGGSVSTLMAPGESGFPATETFVQTATFTHTYAQAGSFYPQFFVRNSAGKRQGTGLSVNVGGTTSSRPQSPFNVTIANAIDKDNSAKIYWENVDGEKFYIYKNKNDGIFQFLAVTGEKFYKDTTGLSRDIKYGYYITALNSYGESSPSSKVYIGPIIAPTPISPLTITTASPLPNAKVGSQYQALLNVSGVAFPVGYNSNNINWSVSSGTLPPGLYLSASDFGMGIFGAPTVEGTYKTGTYNFSLTATTASLSQTHNIGFASTTKQFTLTVNPADVVVVSPLTITTPSLLIGAKVGVAYENYLTASGGTGTYLWTITSGSLPVSFGSPDCRGVNCSSARLYGTPTNAGTWTFGVSATSGSQTTSKQFTLTVSPADVVVVSPTASLTGSVAGSAQGSLLTARVGEIITYRWNSTNANTASSSYVVSPAYTSASNCGGLIGGGPFTWVANSTAGDASATVQGCQAGRAYFIKYTVMNSQVGGGLSADSVLTINVPPITTALNTSLNSNQMANVLDALNPINETVLSAKSFNFTQFLSEGSYGNEVMELQKFLNSAGYDSGTVDGKFGFKTKEALIKFQIANKLKSDGIVGFEVRNFLNK
ncbi:MAG: peptidoglycan-binding protein [Candidatus Paceibacterota bacterium]